MPEKIPEKIPETLFISDLHLSAERPDKITTFENFLESSAGRIDALYILGDLFDAWVGNDPADPVQQRIYQTMRTFSQSNTPLFVIRGNRDIYLDRSFSCQTKAELLDDETVVSLYGIPTLLLHGDQLCTGDRSHQRYRYFISQPWVRTPFLLLPLVIRRAVARSLRRYSKAATAQKPMNITDVDPKTVRQRLMDASVSRMIHGHVHRQAIHSVLLDKASAKRFVLGDWMDTDSVLVCTADSWKFKRVQDYLKENKKTNS